MSSHRRRAGVIRVCSVCFKALLALGGLAGIVLQCGFSGGNWNWLVLRYYTMLSNIFCILYFSVAAVAAAMGREKFLPKWKGMLVMGITVTGLVYHLLLSNGSFQMSGVLGISNFLLHTWTPVLAVLDWLLFDPKGRCTLLDPIRWTLLPDLYFVAATIYGFAGGAPFYGGSRFPYFFIDYDLLGVWSVLLYTVGLNAAFIALGYGYVGVDRLLARRSKRAVPTE